MSARFVYFAFGSNLHPPQMQERCPDCQPLQPATLADYRLAFSGLSRRWGGGAATILPAPGAQVPGLLYRLSAADLQRLDGYENYPEVYDRIEVQVTGRDGTRLAALTYRRHDSDLRAPSLRYFHQIWRSYKALQLDEHLLLQAVEETLASDPHPNGRGRARKR